jgi:phosphopantetheinyl transferase
LDESTWKSRKREKIKRRKEKETGNDRSIYRCHALLQRKELVEALPTSVEDWIW